MTDKTVKPTMAMQSETSDGSTVVGVWNLHVRITCEDGQWFAQGFEIDYAACGSSEEDVKNRFQNGFVATVHEHLTLFGGIDKLLNPVPGDIWQDLRKVSGATQHRYSHIGVHELFSEQDDVLAAFPFDGIEYSTPESAAALVY